jgi:hypothetical protein
VYIFEQIDSDRNASNRGTRIVGRNRFIAPLRCRMAQCTFRIAPTGCGPRVGPPPFQRTSIALGFLEENRPTESSVQWRKLVVGPDKGWLTIVGC